MEEQKDMVLEVENLNVKFVMEEETVEAVNNISLHIKKGETLGLVGETGAGKTTTALSIMRLVDSPPGVLECDKLEVCGQDVMGMSITELEHIPGRPGIHDLPGSDDLSEPGIYCGTADRRKPGTP